MDLFRRLQKVLKAQIASRGKDRILNDFEPWLDFEDTSGPKEPSSEPETEYRSARSSQDPKLAQWYANLEIPYGSDLDTAKKAWRKLMKRYHPDLHGADPEKKAIANELTRKLTEAYRELEKRLDPK